MTSTLCRRISRGDTIVEVMVAITVFSAVAVGAMTIMNRGMNVAQRSLEVTLVRQQIDSQAEMLRYVHGKKEDPAYASLWHTIKQHHVVAPGAVNQLIGASNCRSIGTTRHGFTLAPNTAGNGLVRVTQLIDTAPSYALVESHATHPKSYGVIIQLARSTGGGAYDAHIQACWYGPGSAAAPATLGTIVRIYDKDA